jgi:predicted RNase H-like nuclease (RuvC/YqgF family)
MSRPIIVGYDPGTTAALAIIDTRGEILFVKSKRGFKKNEIIDEITKRGKPIIMAGDRFPLSKKLEKLASSLGCKTFHPYESLSVAEKIELVRDLDEKLKDEHERDALASAIRVFKSYKKLFQKVEVSLSSIGLSGFYDRVVELVFFGKVDNMNDAINRVLTESRIKEKPKIIERKIEAVSKDTVEKLKEKIKSLENDISILKKYNEALLNKIRKSEEQDFIKKEKIDIGTLSSLNNEIKKLRDILKDKELLIEKLKSYRKLELEGYIPVIEIKELRSVFLSDLNGRINLEDRLVYTKNSENAQILNEYKIKSLIIPDEPTETLLKKVSFPVLSEKNISVEKVNNILVVKRDEFEEKVKDARKTGFKKWLEGHKIRKL